MWLQTHNPHHPLLQDLVHNGYGHFARHALMERKAAGLPPFISQFVIRAEATDSSLAYRFLQDSKQVFLQQHAIALNGPFPCLIEKRQGRFRFMLVCSHAPVGIYFDSEEQCKKVSGGNWDRHLSNVKNLH